MFIYIAAAIILFLWALPFTAELDGEEGPALLAFFGRFHILALHLPIGWLLLVPLLEFVGWRWHSDNARVAAGIVLLLGALSAVVAATLGFSLAVADAYAGSVVTTHMWLGIITATTAIIAFLLRDLRSVTDVPKGAYSLVLTASLMAVIYGGHLGGTLVQGEGYLTARLPAGIKRALNIPIREALPIDYEAEIYAAIVQPILRDSCTTCHNNQKYKGKFSMASYESLLQGGKSSRAAVVPGEHEESELYRRVILARQDDDVMPPGENEPLADSEIALLGWWIDLGAPTDRSINDLQDEEFPIKIANIIDDLMDAAEELAPAVPAFDPEVIARQAELLKSEFGLDVYPLSQNPADGLRVETLNLMRPFDELTLQALVPIAEYVRKLDIGEARFNADGFAAITNFSNLDHLTLDHSTIAAGELQYLASLKLRSLNLYGTRLDDDALQQLTQLRSLRHLYLGETGVSVEAVKILIDSLPRCQVVLPSFEV